MSDATKAVFLSYASQDAAAALRLCSELRAVGVEVWFDQSELMGGDAWDAKIRKQIAECALFVPIISANTQARLEGYFRIEWKLAARRTHAMATVKAFLLPVVIDATRDAEAHVPDEFRDVQWTRLRQADGGQARQGAADRDEALEAFCERVKTLLGSSTLEAGRPPGSAGLAKEPRPAPRDEGVGSPAKPRPSRPWLLPAIIAALALGSLALWRPWSGPKAQPSLAASAAPTSDQASTSQTEVQKLLARAWVLYEKMDDATGQDWALAEDLAAQAVKLEPTNADAWAAYSQATLGPWVFGYDRTTTRFSDARGRAERALGLAPDSFEARFAGASCHRRLNATRPEAEKTLRALVTERPADKRVIRMLAHTLRDLGRTDEALQWLDRAAALPGGDPIAVWGKFSVYVSAGRLDEAEAVVTQSLAIHRGPTALLRQVALRLVWHGDLEGAAAALRDVPGPFLQKAEGIYGSYLLGRWQRDSKACFTALQLAGGDFIDGGNYLPSLNGVVPTGLWRGDAFALSGNRDAAEKSWRDALAVVERRAREQPGESTWTFWRASLHARLGERAEGLRHYRLFQQLAGIEHTTPVARLSLSHETMVLAPLVLLGELDEAFAGWEKAVATAATPRSRETIRHELRLDPLYDGLRENPRFRTLVAAPVVSTIAPAGAKSAPALSSAGPVRGDEKSIAVLAFANMSAEKDTGYFSDGISEELLNVLAKIPGLKVTARTSAFHFKGKDTPIPEIARQLGVAYVVEGSVRKAGDKVRITAQLIKAEDGFPVWTSGNLDRELKDIFAVQDEIAGLIAKNLQLKLGDAPRTARTVNPAAFSLLLEARQYVITISVGNLAKAEALYRRALEIDPEFTQAAAELVVMRATSTTSRCVAARYLESELSEIERAARDLLRRDPSLGEAHAALGLVLGSRDRGAEAGKEFEKARALGYDPEQWSHRTAFSHFQRGRPDLAISAMEEARRMNPLAWTPIDVSGLGYLFTRRYAAAVEAFRTAARMAGPPVTSANLALGLIGLGRKEEAIAAARQALTVPNRADWLPEFLAWSDGLAAWALAQAGGRSEAEAIVRRLLDGPVETRYAANYALAELGRLDEAAPTLEDMVAVPGYLFFLLNERPALLGDARFARLLQVLRAEEDFATFRRVVTEVGGKK